MDKPDQFLRRKIKESICDDMDDKESISLDDCTPLSWTGFFSEEMYLETNEGKFHLLCAGQSGPVCFLIHGAGFSSLTWCLFAKELLDLVDVRLVAMDLRGHGLTATKSDDVLSKEVLVNDVKEVIEIYMDKLGLNEKIFLIGHSLGGAIVTWLASLHVVKDLCGIAVVDVDEQAALNQEDMLTFVSSRPQGFTSMAKAIKYSHTQRKVSNLLADRISMPGQIKPLVEENNKGKQYFVWRLDLLSTQPYWKEWFSGFSEAFMSLKLSRLLIIADLDRMNRTLLIGQMQGLFRVEPMEHCGHTVQEDNPEHMARAIANFLKHQKLL